MWRSGTNEGFEVRLKISEWAGLGWMKQYKYLEVPPEPSGMDETHDSDSEGGRRNRLIIARFAF